MPKTEYILVIANSARMLAQAARNAGMLPLAIDLFGDYDTRIFAESYHKVTALDNTFLQPAIEDFCQRYVIKAAVYGSGFESRVESLCWLKKYLTMYGNTPEVFDALTNKRGFFALLDYLAIPYPKVSFSQPQDSEGWLVKPLQGQGGIGIKKYCKTDAPSFDIYWQKYQDGEPHSVLFLADGERCQIVGYNRQWTTAIIGKYKFVFSGIMNHTGLTGGQKARLAEWLDRLVPIFSIRGLNSLDFIQDGDASYLLEINPRPPASMQLYDNNLFGRHICACQGELPGYQSVQSHLTGYQVVYAEQELQIPAAFEWPEYVMDIPCANTIISAGQPICSMITHGYDPQTVFTKLQQQQEFIINALKQVSSSWNIVPVSML